MPTATRRALRQALLEDLGRKGREHSDATVLFHATVASLLNLHPTDDKVLGMLDRLGPLSAGEIARHSGLATPSVTNLIDRLEQRGFVRRVRDSADRRRVLVEPVDSQIRKRFVRFGSARRSLQRLLQRYSDRELTTIADFLDRNSERLRLETRRLTSRTRA